MMFHSLEYAALSAVYAATAWVSIAEQQLAHALCAAAAASVYAALSRRG